MRLDKGIAAAILAGGFGTRLRSVVSDRPKVLAPVAGRPFLVYLLEQLASASVRSVLLLVGHGAALVRTTLGDRCAGVELRYSEEPSPLGTAGAVRWGLEALEAPTVLLLNGDSYCAVNLTGFFRFHRQHDSQVSLVLARAENTARYGRVAVGNRDQVVRFQEKGVEGPGWINAGIYLLARRLLEELPASQPLSLEQNLLPAWVVRPGVRGYCSPGRFLDIGTPESYASAERFFGWPDQQASVQ